MKRTTTDKMMRALGTGRIEIMHTKRQLQKWSKAKLIREIIKLESILLRIAIKLYKSKLPRLRTIRQKALPKRKTKRKSLAYNDLGFGESLKSMRKKKRKFSQRQLAAQRLFAKRARAGTLRRR